MQHSEQLNELAAALAKAQAVMEGAKKDSKNPFLKNSYADLSSVWDACRKPLTDNGLSVIQTVSLSEGGETQVTTMLVHSSGQYVKDTLPIFTKEKTAQGIGSAITYARRYALAAVAGVSPADDDDGEGATGRLKPQANLTAKEATARFQAPPTRGVGTGTATINNPVATVNQ